MTVEATTAPPGHARPAERASEHERGFSDSFLNVPIGIYRTSADGRILLANPALAADMSLEAVARAAGYRWSITAARLRRLYADLTSRQLVECR